MKLGPSPAIVDRRVLGALELLDASTGERITAPMEIHSDVLGTVQNRSGLHVFNSLTPRTDQQRQLAEHLTVFEEAPSGLADGAVSLVVTIKDPAARYVPRRQTVAFPRGEEDDSAIAVNLFPAPAAPVGQNWSGIRARLEQQVGGEDVPLAGARIRLLRDSDDAILGEGYSDLRGEALVTAVGIPVIDFTTENGDGDTDLVGTKKVISRIEFHTGAGQAWPPDPEAIEDSGQAWEPVSGTLPKPELETGKILTDDLTFLLKPTS